MTVVARGLDEVIEAPSVVTIGNFDGVHRGHQALLRQLIEHGRERQAPSVLITFEPLPREYFRGTTMPSRLTRFREKVALLAPLGLDRLLCLPFNEALAQRSADYVVRELLVRGLGVHHVVVGDDFRFGQGREGDFALLQRYGAELGFGVSDLGTQAEGSERISSTRIRELLAAGELVKAEHMLGHPYFIMGRVVYGRQLGHTLGVPTANIQLQRYRAALEGVFVVEVNGLDRPYQGVANVGVRPTVDGRQPLLEVHLFDYSDNLYGRLLKVRFRHKLRDERKFESLDALKTQIHRDMDQARAWIATQGPLS